MTANTLLSHIVRHFASGRHEDLTTEALAHVLMESLSARRALASFAEGLTDRRFEIVRVATQATDAASASRPDLVAFDHEGEPSLLVEAKFDAGLTANQPHTYLRRTRGLVLVVCPDRRIEMLWPELLRRCATVGNVDERPTAGATRVAAVDGVANLGLTNWQTLLLHIRAAVATDEPAVLGDIDQLLSLCAVFEADTFIPLTSDELTSDLSRRIQQFTGLVDDLVSRLVADPDVNKDGLRASAGPGWYGHYLNLPSGYAALLHFSADKWARLAATPIWIWLKNHWSSHNPAAVERTLAPLWGTMNQPVLSDGLWQVPLHPPTAADRDAVIEALMAQVVEVVNLVRAASDPVPGEGSGEPAAV